MLTIGPIGFLLPWLLVPLIGLPVLWWLLRAIPPRPNRLKFPGVWLLLGLKDTDTTPDRTPWWLLALRVGAVAAMILGFAGPVLDPENRAAGSGPLLLLVDGSWANAPDWAGTMAQLEEELELAKRNGRLVAVHFLTAPIPFATSLEFVAPQTAQQSLAALVPKPWAADRAGFVGWLQALAAEPFETRWYSDGLQSDADAELFETLRQHGQVTFFAPENGVIALGPVEIVDGKLGVDLLRTESSSERSVRVLAIGPDPSGQERILAQVQADFKVGEESSTASFDMPTELRNRVGRITLQGLSSAGTTVLLDQGSKRRKVGLIAGGAESEGQQYTSPLFYLRKALNESAELIEAPLADTLAATPDVIILADVGTITPAERVGLEAWVREGGLLVRFAGPRLAQSGAGQLDVDPLLPVRLRSGGRNVGGAMSWGDPKKLSPFPENSLFIGLPVSNEVTVTAQVVAQPDPDLPGKVLAALEDGTPMVTATALEQGRVVLFHVTANADWSNLPLSGLFVEMLQRLVASARSAANGSAELEGQFWQAESVMDGFGALGDAQDLPGVTGERLAEHRPGPDAPPGLYTSGERDVAVNILQKGEALLAMAKLPDGVIAGQFQTIHERNLKPILLAAALVALFFDIIATLYLLGRLARPLSAAVALALFLPNLSPSAKADDDIAILATNETVLAYVQTGDAKVDDISHFGLSGLTRILNERTSVEPIAPLAVNLETDELAFFPFLYWPVTEVQETPTDAAFTKINAYLRNGGMILFDTRDAGLGGSGTSANGEALQRLTEKLDIPPLEPLPAEHVLTRSFYLLTEFPGRWNGSDIWVEAAPKGEITEGVPFRNQNDGVTPVIIGGNDWAAAWAMTDQGQSMFPVGRGIGGERQREMAWRFGVNIIMHVMTGNYKSDQVHIPALLERLGQ